MAEMIVLQEPAPGVKVNGLMSFFFLMWTIFQVFIEFITILFLFYILLILASRNVEKIPTKD